MDWSWNSIRRAVCAVVGVVLIAGVASAEQTTITFWGWPVQDKHIQAALDGFHELHPDIDVNLRMMPIGDVHQKLIVGLASGGDIPDVSMVEISRINDLRRSDQLTDLSQPAFNGNRYRDQFVPYKWEQAHAPNGALIAIPIDIGPAALYYRRTDFDRAGLPSNPEVLIDQMRTWSQYEEMGKKLTQDRNGDGEPDQFLIGDAHQIWGIAQAQTKLPMISPDGTVNVDAPGWIDALTNAVDVRRRGFDAYKQIQYTWSQQWGDGLASGLLATEMMGSWFGGFLKNSYAPDSSGQWGVLPTPGEVGVNQGGSFVVIPSASKHKAAAWAFVQYMFATEASQALMLKTVDYFPAFIPAWSDPVMQQPDAYFGDELVRLIYIEEARRTPPVYVDPLTDKANPILSKAVDQVFAGTLAPKAALEGAAQQIRGLVAGAQRQG